MSNQVSSYQAVINVLADTRFDGDIRALLVQVAKSNPQAVVDAAAVLWMGQSFDNVVSELIRGVRDKGWTKIDAIKHHRTLTGQGLKESKEFVESIPELTQLMFDNNRKYVASLRG